MIDTFKARMDILPLAQRQLWPSLRSAASLGFVLYGGTAIALRLGHRSSVDFDFFSDQPLDRDTIYSVFPFAAQATVIQDQPNALSMLAPLGDEHHSHVKVSFFGTIGFGRVGTPQLSEDGVLQVASLDDLMATKIKVVLQRAEAKDYRDIAAMLAAQVDLAKGIAAARVFFGSSFQPSESLKALSYYNDGDLHTLTKDERKILVSHINAVGTLPRVSIIARTLAAQ